MPTLTLPIKRHFDRRAGQLAEQGQVTGNDDDLLTSQQLADWLGVSLPWVEITRSQGNGPPFVRLNPNNIKYRRDAVVEWLKQREYTSTAQYAHSGGHPRKTPAVNGHTPPIARAQFTGPARQRIVIKRPE
jgi:hypothetical protein